MVCQNALYFPIYVCILLVIKRPIKSIYYHMVQNKHCVIPDVVSFCELATAQVWQLYRNNFSQVFFSLNIDFFFSLLEFHIALCFMSTVFMLSLS